MDNIVFGIHESIGNLSSTIIFILNIANLYNSTLNNNYYWFNYMILLKYTNLSLSIVNIILKLYIYKLSYDDYYLLIEKEIESRTVTDNY